MPKVRLSETTYRDWLDESPKPIAGPCEIDYDENGNPFVPQVPFSSRVLPDHYGETLVFFGSSDRFSGLKLYATPTKFEMLVRGDYRHGARPWRIGPNEYSGEQPHFHELDFSGGRRRPASRKVVPTVLVPGMPIDDFTQGMLAYYAFEPEGLEVSAPPDSPRFRQARLFEESEP